MGGSKRKNCRSCGARQGHRPGCPNRASTSTDPGNVPVDAIPSGSQEPMEIDSTNRKRMCPFCHSSTRCHKRHCPNGPSGATPPIAVPAVPNAPPADPPIALPVVPEAPPADLPVVPNAPPVDPPIALPIMPIVAPPVHPPIALPVHNEPILPEEDVVEDMNILETCDFCGREGCDSVPLDLTILGDNFIRIRVVGLLTARLTPNSMVCYLCKSLLTNRATHGHSWSTAWAAAIASMLTRPQFRSASTSLKILPTNILNMWRNLPDVLEHCLEHFVCEKATSDITIRKRHFNEENASGVTSRFLDAHKVEAFPNVLCAAGCTMFVDEALVPIGFHHYIAARYSTTAFSMFNADANKLIGMRPDWPHAYKVCGQLFQGGIIVDRLCGLSIVTCQKHSSLEHQYVHTPRNPVLDSDGIWFGNVIDPFAPVVSSVSLVKMGSSGRSTSFPKVSLKSNNSGLSTFRLTTGGTYTPTKHPSLLKIKLNTIINNESAKRNMKHLCTPLVMASIYASHREDLPTAEEYSKLSATGTFVTMVDTVQCAQFYCDSSKTDSNMIKLLNPLSLNTEYGRYAFKSINNAVRNSSKSVAVLSLMLAMFRNCRALHVLCLYTYKEEAPNTVLFDILAVFVNFLSPSKMNNITVNAQFRASAQRLMHIIVENVEEVTEHCSVNNIAGYGIAFLLKKTKVFHWGPAADPLECFFDSEELAIVVLTDDDEEIELPVVDEQDKFYLLIKSNTDELEDDKFFETIALRWDRNLKWLHHNGRNQIISDVCNVNKKVNIYISKYFLSGMIKDQLFNVNGVQNTLLCATHDTTFLMREARNTLLYCPSARCRKKISWRCSFGFGGGNQCQVGLCKKHAQDHFDNIEQQVHLHLKARLAGEAPVEGIGEGEENDIQLPVVPVQVDGYEVFFNEDLPLFTDNHTVPLAAHEFAGGNSVCSTYILNQDLRSRDDVHTPGRQSIGCQQALQQMYSRCGTGSLPLLYPNGELSPIIHYSVHNDTVPVGGLPSILYTRFGNKPIRGGLASFHDHCIIHLLNLALPTSRDVAYLCQYFDAYINRCVELGTQMFVMKKGLETLHRFHLDKKDDCPLQFHGGHREAEKLSKSMKDNGHWDFFITLTCNENLNPSLRVIKDAAKKTFDPQTHAEEFQLLMQNLLSVMCRAFERYVRHFFEHLITSDEVFFGGKVTHFWYRFEFQSAGGFGNLPHVHAGVQLRDKSSYSDKLYHTSLMEMRVFGFRHHSLEGDLRRAEIVKTDEEYIEIREAWKQLHSHDCNNSRQRCQKRVDAYNRYMCRVPRYPISAEGRVVLLPQVYSLEAQNILKMLGILTVDGFGNQVLPDVLRHFRFEYSNDGIVGSPTNGKIFCIFRSSTNVQVVDKRFQSSYVVKYAAGTDEKRDVDFEMTRKDQAENTVRVRERPLYNAKISGPAILEAYARKNQKIQPLAKEVCITELFWHISGLLYVNTNMLFVDISLCPPDRRGLSKKSFPNVYSSLKDANGLFKSVAARRNLEIWRQFSEPQLAHLQDILESVTYPDPVARFNVRSPELMFVTDVESYNRWFIKHRPKNPVEIIDPILQTSPFVDGLGSVIRVRIRYLPDVTEYLRNLPAAVEGVAPMLALFQRLTALATQEPSEVLSRFVDMQMTSDVTVMYYRVPPCNASDFLYYFLLRFGKVKTERQLFEQHTLISAFQAAELIADVNATQAELHILQQRYILEELAFLSVGQKTFEAYMKSAMTILKSFLIDGDIEIVGAPCISEAAIQADASDKLSALAEERLTQMLDFVDSLHINEFPTRDEILAGNARNWLPNLQNLEHQSQQSIAEQRLAIDKLINSINALQDPGFSFVKSQWVCGPPGSGKSHVMFHALAYCLCQQITCCIVSFTADRARAVGGCHLHMLFLLKVYKSQEHDVNIEVNDALKNLMKSPHKLAYLKRLRVMFFEEIGLISAEMLSVIDNLLRKIKEDDRPFGGVLLIASGDHRQLSPINGNHVWLSSLLLTSVDILSFKHLVRSSGDEDLQTLINVIRKPIIGNHLITKCREIVSRRCGPRVIPSWNEVDENYLRIVSTKQAMNECEQQYLDRKRNNPNVQLILSKAKDEIRLRNQDQFVDAQPQHSKELDRMCAERASLLVILHSIMQLTYNNNRPTANMPVFSQGQRCIVVSLPRPEVAENDPQYRVHVRLIPAGAQVESVLNIPEQWPLLKLRVRQTANISVGGSQYGTLARRRQFPLSYYICLTIHKTIGATCDRVATFLSLDKKYMFWEREMLLVLISRVRNLDHLVFVGSLSGTWAAFNKLMRKVDKKAVYIDTRIEALNIMNPNMRLTRVLTPPQQKFIGLTCQIPEHSTGFVYLFLSSSVPSVFFINHSLNIRREITHINKSCNEPTTLNKRPWIIGAYACNFPQTTPRELNNSLRRFYNNWNDAEFYQRLHLRRPLTWQEMIRAGSAVAQDFNAANLTQVIYNICLYTAQNIP